MEHVARWEDERKGVFAAGLGGGGSQAIDACEVLALFIGVVGRADEWAGFDEVESDGEGEFLPFSEFLRRDPSIYGQVS